MRLISVRCRHWAEFDGAQQALEHAAKIESRLRTVADSEVRGRTVTSASWSDSTLELGLSDRRFLRFVARGGRVVCAVEAGTTTPQAAEDRTIEIKFPNGNYLWHRAEIANRYVGGMLQRLFFGDIGVFVYAQGLPILLCMNVEAVDSATDVLLWDFSD
jgi:hypothetical protein